MVIRSGDIADQFKRVIKVIVHKNSFKKNSSPPTILST